MNTTSLYNQNLKLLTLLLAIFFGLISCSEPMEVENAPSDGDPIVADSTGNDTHNNTSQNDTSSAIDDASSMADDGAYPAGEDGAYPASNVGYDPGYPVPVPTLIPNLSDTPPDPDVALPQNMNQDTAVIGGALIQEISGTGYVPLTPIKLYLGKVLMTENGVQSHMSRSSSSPTAELFDTGVFIFRDIVPGTYGLIVDLGMDQFIVDRDGEPLLITIEGGEVIDLEQVIVTIPGIE